MNISYLAIRALTFPLSFLPFKLIHLIGKGAGTLAYFTMTKYRKRALSNLSLAENLDIKDLKKVAKASFQNLAITTLEYSKFSRIKNTKDVIICENPELAKQLIDKGTGIIFFCGHQANWELLFLEGTQQMPGIAVGRPIKNPRLYKWIVSIREKFGGTIITPKETIKEGLRALKKGKFLGIVGDQALPESDYAFDFFGRRAWTTPAPAILSYRTLCPIMVATIRRKTGKYFIHYSDPIWPNPDITMEEEIHRMMKESLLILENDIRKRPGQWLWQHNRWKQETPDNVYYRYRWDTILIVLPKDFDLNVLQTFREIYPKAFITILTPLGTSISINEVEVLYYEKEKELFTTDYRFKLVFNFSGNKKLRRHFMKQSAFEVLDDEALKNGVAQEHLLPSDDFSMLLKKALTRPNTLWRKDAT
ncbi:MAG: hypothetical protein P0S93_01205 [Candidatus Neptunochlamydia sp.]|nr:hypothetical protein [Candidatus Neptunochlamydia sp.]